MKFLNKKKLGKTGECGENAAADYLAEIGYEIVGRNVICDGHEIDIIAKDIKYIVFVEVKTRTVYKGLSRFGSAASSVDKVKQRRIITAAKAYLKQTNHRRVPRYDIVEVYIDDNKIQRINHIPRAFGSGR